jgi:short subunit dehydrogenase
VFGVVAVTNAFLPALRRSARPRIVNISSGTGSLTWATDPQSRHWSGRYAAYRSSKTALNAVTVFYARTLVGDAIKVNVLAPGPRRTDLNVTAAASEGDPAEAAAAAVRLALLPDDGPTGEFFSWDGTPVPGDRRHLGCARTSSLSRSVTAGGHPQLSQTRGPVRSRRTPPPRWSGQRGAVPARAGGPGAAASLPGR